MFAKYALVFWARTRQRGSTVRPLINLVVVGHVDAGKSTLMDVLTGRKTVGRITGKVTVNGHDKDDATFARISGYCEQFDSHAPGTSVCFLTPVLG